MKAEWFDFGPACWLLRRDGRILAEGGWPIFSYDRNDALRMAAEHGASVVPAQRVKASECITPSPHRDPPPSSTSAA